MAWAAGLKSLWIAINLQYIIVNFFQDFVGSMHGDFFQWQTDRGLFYRPTHSGETLLYKQEDNQDDLLLLRGDKKSSSNGEWIPNAWRCWQKLFSFNLKRCNGFCWSLSTTQEKNFLYHWAIDTLKLTGQNLGRVFNSKCGCVDIYLATVLITKRA